MHTPKNLLIAFKNDLPYHVQPRADVSGINVD